LPQISSMQAKPIRSNQNQKIILISQIWGYSYLLMMMRES